MNQTLLMMMTVESIEKVVHLERGCKSVCMIGLLDEYVVFMLIVVNFVTVKESSSFRLGQRIEIK